MRSDSWGAQAPVKTVNMSHGVGHVFRIGGDRPTVVVPRRVIKPDTPAVDWRAVWSRYEADNCAETLRGVSTLLGYAPDTLWRSGAVIRRDGWVCWPMFDGQSRIIGIRTRQAVASGAAKRAVRGSHAGLFVPRVPVDVCAFDLLVEGPTDMAACLQLGVNAIGRPSNTGGVDHLCEYLSRRNVARPVVVVADRDVDKTRPDGTTFNPGMDGATALQSALFKRLGLQAPVIFPPLGAKDMRAALLAGCTAHALQSVLRMAR